MCRTPIVKNDLIRNSCCTMRRHTDQLVAELLVQRWSPQQISRHLRRRFPGQPGLRLCHESIYQPGSPLAPQRRSPCGPGVITGAPISAVTGAVLGLSSPMLTISQRPFPPEDRLEAGHWEGDLIIGKDQQSAIGTLVERQTRIVRLLHLPRRDGDALHAALRARMGDLPSALLRSIT
jgi:transposase, IS30 family